MPFGKSKEPKEKKPKKEKPPKLKKPKRGKELPVEQLDESGQPIEPKKKKFPILFLIISLVVIVAAAVIVFVFILPGRNADDPDANASVEPDPPVLPTEIPIGDDVSIVGMALGSDESGALVQKSKQVTYTYTNLNDAGKAAETYAAQLAEESPAFYVVDEEFVRQRGRPDYTPAEGMVLLARNVPVDEPAATATPEPAQDESQDPENSATPTPEPEPTPEPVTYVHTVRITWSEGVCVVVVDEQEGKVTNPQLYPTPAAQNPVTLRSAQERLSSMTPAELGLAGESMDSYEVMSRDGTEMVDDLPCIRLDVYSRRSASGTFDFQGSYLMSLDGMHLYRLNPVNNEIEELEYTPG